MKISAPENSEAEELACDSKKCQKQLGKNVADRVERAIEELWQAENLAQIKSLPFFDFHPLGDRYKGDFTLKLNKQYSVDVSPDPKGNWVKKEDGSIDLSSVKSVIIKQIGDHHD
jgi:plasmid maintenance system killer protein